MRILAILLLVSLILGCQNGSVSTESEQSKDTVREEFEENPDARKALFGDLHIHSSWSFDAFIYNVRTTPDDAYRFGKGESINHPISGRIQNARPLDFMAVSDHAEYMGIMMQMGDPENDLAKLDIANRIRSKDREESIAAFGEIGMSLSRNQPIKELIKKDIIASTWQRQIEIANKHYEPGKFTTFPAYEWTSSPANTTDPNNTFAANMHRNVIYRGDKVSAIPFSSFDSQNPEELWKWMEKEKKDGIDLIAIPHNANMSNGLMYAVETFEGQPMDAAYAKLRMDNEPINEVAQIKGQSMSHPLLNRNDEFSNFEIYAFTFAVGPPPASQPQGSYVREAYQNGLKMQQSEGFNPFQFGVIGSSDGHNSASPSDEDNYFGKLGNVDGNPETRMASSGGDRFLRSKLMSAAGLAGVWAEENNRSSIYASMTRKEVFATSGPRIQVRMFVSDDFDINFNSKDWVKSAYDQGVPMGGTFNASEKKPHVVVWAAKDPMSANLDRIQIIKQWVDKSGQAQETIFDVAYDESRQKDASGKLLPITNTVDVKNATYTNEYGAAVLQSIWVDETYEPGQNPLYLARVLEVPTPRWSTYDAKALGIEVPNNVDASIQERAWSSPVWIK